MSIKITERCEASKCLYSKKKHYLIAISNVLSSKIKNDEIRIESKGVTYIIRDYNIFYIFWTKYKKVIIVIPRSSSRFHS